LQDQDFREPVAKQWDLITAKGIVKNSRFWMETAY